MMKIIGPIFLFFAMAAVGATMQPLALRGRVPATAKVEIIETDVGGEKVKISVNARKEFFTVKEEKYKNYHKIHIIFH